MSYELQATFATLPRTERGRPMVLGGDPKGKNFLYTNGKSVIIRNIENPSIADIYSEHSVATTCAKYSPSGFYIASADQSGKVRIWDTTQKEHILKNEFQPFAGPVKDLAWSGDSQKIVAVGEGKERFGHVFNMDTGTSVGEIMGQSKSINAVDFRPQRPFRIATASEDNTIAFFHGPPFKFQFTKTDHSRFVNCLRYSPDGEFFASGGADGQSFVYDGKTGDKTGELGAPAHKGGIYGVCFSPDSKQVLTASADKSAKVWDVATGAVVHEWVMGTKVEDMQVGCLWQGEFIITVSLSGHINYLDRADTSKPSRIIKGHNKAITAMTLTDDKQTVFTAAADGGICRWNVQNGENDMLEGHGHTNQVQDMVVSDDVVVTCGMDDTVMFTPVRSQTYGQQVKLSSMPKGITAASGGLTVVACINEVLVLRHGNIVYRLKADFEPQCAAIHPGQLEVVVGGSSDQKVHLYGLSSDTLTEKRTLDHGGALTGLEYSPDGAMLAACDAYRKVVLYQLPDYKPLTTTEWSYHTAKINCLSWTPDCRHVASGALDTQIIVWSPEKKMQYIVMKGAHQMSQVTRIAWIDNNTLISSGQDCNLKRWSVTHY